VVVKPPIYDSVEEVQTPVPGGVTLSQGSTWKSVQLPNRGSQRERQFEDTMVKATAYDRVDFVPADVAGGVAWSYKTSGDGGEISKVPREKSKHRVRIHWQKQLVDVVVLPTVNDRVDLIGTNVSGGVTGGMRSSSDLGKIFQPPSQAAVGKPQFVDVVVQPAIDDRVNIVGTDIASGAAGSAEGRSGEGTKITQLPSRTSQGKEQFVDVVIKPAVQNRVAIVRPAICGNV
jgi:hypothetical protein